MKKSKFKIFCSPKNGQYYFHLTAKNGKIILQSEGYVSKQSCIKTAKAIMRVAAGAVIEINK